jgi:hypothetical protein
VIFIGPPGTGKTPSDRARYRACQAGLGYWSPPPAKRGDRLADAHSAGRLQGELIRLAGYPPLIIDEVGYIPFEPEAANLFFQLVSSRHERASLIVTSNKALAAGEAFGDTVVAVMIERLVQYAVVVALKGYLLPTQEPRPRVPGGPKPLRTCKALTTTSRCGLALDGTLQRSSARRQIFSIIRTKSTLERSIRICTGRAVVN